MGTTILHCVTNPGTVSPVSEPQERQYDPFVSFRLPRERVEELTLLAKAKGYKRSAFIRLILDRGLPFARDIAPNAAVPNLSKRKGEPVR